MVGSLDQVKNFVRVNVDGTHTDTDTEISIEADDIDELPDPDDGEYNLVWWDTTEFNLPENDPNTEIVRATSIDNDDNVLTVERGREDTGASSKDTEDRSYQMIMAPTAKMFTDAEELFTTFEDDIENFSTQGEEGTVPVSQGDGTLEMAEPDAEGGFTATQSLIELGVDEMVQMTRFVAPDDTKIQVFGGGVSDENGESFAEETEVELFNHSTGETLFVIDDVNLEQGEPLFEDTVGDDELEFRLVNASSETKNLSGKMLFDILEV